MKPGFSRLSWYGGRTSYPTRCRDIIERIARKRYVCPHEVRLLIDRMARKWDVEVSKIEQHAFSNTYAERYKKDGVGDRKGSKYDSEKGCAVKGCAYDYVRDQRSWFGKRETRCVICLKERADDYGDCHNKFILENRHFSIKEDYCGEEGKGHWKCMDILHKVDPYRQTSWNKVKFNRLSFEDQGIFILGKFLLQKAENLLRYRRKYHVRKKNRRNRNEQNVSRA